MRSHTYNIGENLVYGTRSPQIITLEATQVMNVRAEQQLSDEDRHDIMRADERMADDNDKVIPFVPST